MFLHISDILQKSLQMLGCKVHELPHLFFSRCTFSFLTNTTIHVFQEQLNPSVYVHSINTDMVGLYH